MANWPVMIVGMTLINNALNKTDRKNLWEYNLPKLRMGRGTEAVYEIQKKLKVKFSKEYEEFLIETDGWNCFFQEVDLFGTSDLEPDSDKMKRAMRMLERKRAKDSELRKMKGKLLPIGASRDDDGIWLILLVIKGRNFGKTICFCLDDPDDEGVCWDASFEDFFLSMMECQREHLEQLMREEIAAGRVPETVWTSMEYPFQVMSKQHLKDLRTGSERYYPMKFKGVSKIIFEGEEDNRET